MKRLSQKTRQSETYSEMSTVKKTATKPNATAPAKEGKADEPKPSVLPNDVLRAINEARKKDPKDKHGDGAFRIHLERLRAYQNEKDKKRKSTYAPFEVNIRGNWMPLNIRVMNAKTTAGIREPEKREYGVDLQFRRSTTFTIRNSKGEDDEQKYGEAVCAAYEAFGRLAAKAIADGKMKNSNPSVHSKVQYTAKNKDTKKDENLEDPIFRVDLRLENKESNDPQFLDLKDSIRDVRRKLDKIPKGAVMPYDLAQDPDGNPLTPATIHTFFRSGTPCFGVHCMDQMAISASGFSVPGFFTLLAAKKPKGKKPAFENHFTQDEVNQWADAEAYDEEAEGDEGGDEGADDAGAEEGADADAYDDVLEAIKQDASEGDAVDGVANGAEEAAVEPDDAALDALEETPAEPEPVPEPKKPATKSTPAKKGSKK